MSVKLHFLFSHIDRFPDNLGAISDEQGELFHMDLKTQGECYHGRWDRHVMTVYYWNLKWNCPETVHDPDSFEYKFLHNWNVINQCIFKDTNFLHNNEFHINYILCINENVSNCVENKLRLCNIHLHYLPTNWKWFKPCWK